MRIPGPTVRRIPRIGAIATTLAALLLLGVASGPAQQPIGPSWPERQERIDRLLAEGKWEAAHKQARKLGDDIVSRAWEQPEASRRLATVGRCLAVAEINLGMERAALWHWYAAWNLAPPTNLDEIAALGHTGALVESKLRTLGEVPAGYIRLGDLELLRLEEAVIPEVERPILTNDSASRGGRVPDLLIEVLIDRNGVLLHPVVDDTGVPDVGVWATLEWLLTYPPVQPATIDGDPVDALRLLTIEFGRERRRGSRP